ncbi:MULTISPECIES: hypothetical protein [Parageobacillus]|jgi:hypothetical protein|uniref:hypothetical protein n=1 Tax=Parageobacillus TaxID=1906945 RepID=UPI000ABADA0F|nr:MULTISPECIES: hypothetical protein [Parageobacillus]BDG48398.1 hypothetical protein PspKH34_29590 [Parageobacillus sp. KH3-4]
MVDDQEQTKQHNEQADRFSRLMFGSFPPRSRQSRDESVQNEFSSQQGLDFSQLMQNIDTLISSFDQLKPLMKKITSFVNMLKK